MAELVNAGYFSKFTKVLIIKCKSVGEGELVISCYCEKISEYHYMYKCRLETGRLFALVSDWCFKCVKLTTLLLDGYG